MSLSPSCSLHLSLTLSFLCALALALLSLFFNFTQGISPESIAGTLRKFGDKRENIGENLRGDAAACAHGDGRSSAQRTNPRLDRAVTSAQTVRKAQGMELEHVIGLGHSAFRPFCVCHLRFAFGFDAICATPRATVRGQRATTATTANRANTRNLASGPYSTRAIVPLFRS